MSEEVNEKTLLAREELAGHYKSIINLLGEDVDREGLLKTPERVAKAMQFLTKGYHEDPAAVLRGAMFKEEDYKQMVIVKDIDFFSLCEHHMLPFFGKAHVDHREKREDEIGLRELEDVRQHVPDLLKELERKCQKRKRKAEKERRKNPARAVKEFFEKRFHGSSRMNEV